MSLPAPYYEDEWVTLYADDALAVLREMPDESVQCCVTSPPYWGLRDYGADGQIGLEATPEEYVERLVEVFREVRRLLRPDGTLWLNLGDCYASHPPGIQSAERYKASTLHGAAPGLSNGVLSPATSGKLNTIVSGLKPKDLVGIPWRVAFALQQPHEVVTIRDRADRAWLAALIDGEGCITTTVAKPTTGVNESYAIVLQVRMSDRECLDRVVAITGMSRVQNEASPPSHAANGQRPVFCWKVAGDNAAAILSEIAPYLFIKRRQAVAAWNLQRLKDGVVTKRGVPVPVANMEQRRELHRVIRALNQREGADLPGWCRQPSFHVEPGWYLRSDVIWAKPNPMPESVRDRPTKAHEYLFLLSKSERYYYDAEAIAEDAVSESVWKFTDGGRDKKRGHGRRHAGFNGRYAERLAEDGPPATRNRRSVWTISTKPYPDAHFAVFPPELPRLCIQAGCPEGGVVLDPFAGSGTTLHVAKEAGRRAVGIEINTEYCDLAAQRCSQGVLDFGGDAA
jgi:DNA modification methylase